MSHFSYTKLNFLATMHDVSHDEVPCSGVNEAQSSTRDWLSRSLNTSEAGKLNIVLITCRT